MGVGVGVGSGEGVEKAGGVTVLFCFRLISDRDKENLAFALYNYRLISSSSFSVTLPSAEL